MEEEQAARAAREFPCWAARCLPTGRGAMDTLPKNGLGPWRELFQARAAAGAGAPGLGVDFVRASQKHAALALPAGEQELIFRLQQDLEGLGLGAVLWDCVSSPSKRGGGRERE